MTEGDRSDAPHAHEGSRVFVILFALVLAYGVFAFVRVFLVERYSETELLRLTPRWLLPVVFGVYGVVAERLYRVSWKLDVKLLVIASIVMAGLPVLVLVPFALLRLGSVAVALAGALMWWQVILRLFLAVIWPMM